MTNPSPRRTWSLPRGSCEVLASVWDKHTVLTGQRGTRWIVRCRGSSCPPDTVPCPCVSEHSPHQWASCGSPCLPIALRRNRAGSTQMHHRNAAASATSIEQGTRSRRGTRHCTPACSARLHPSDRRGTAQRLPIRSQPRSSSLQHMAHRTAPSPGQVRRRIGQRCSRPRTGACRKCRVNWQTCPVGMLLKWQTSECTRVRDERVPLTAVACVQQSRVYHVRWRAPSPAHAKPGSHCAVPERCALGADVGVV